MSSFDYLKTAIKQQGCTLQQVADASGMTKGYLSQLLNAKIKSPSAQKLEALHRFLGLEFPRRQKNMGVVFHRVGSPALVIANLQIPKKYSHPRL